MNMRLLPLKARWLAWRWERMLGDLEKPPLHSTWIPGLRLGLHPKRSFTVGWRRLVKKGERRGVLVVSMGWLSATVPC